MPFAPHVAQNVHFYGHQDTQQIADSTSSSGGRAPPPRLGRLRRSKSCAELELSKKGALENEVISRFVDHGLRRVASENLLEVHAKTHKELKQVKKNELAMFKEAEETILQAKRKAWGHKGGNVGAGIGVLLAGGFSALALILTPIIPGTAITPSIGAYLLSGLGGYGPMGGILGGLVGPHLVYQFSKKDWAANLAAVVCGIAGWGLVGGLSAISAIGGMMAGGGAISMLTPGIGIGYLVVGVTAAWAAGGGMAGRMIGEHGGQFWAWVCCLPWVRRMLRAKFGDEVATEGLLHIIKQKIKQEILDFVDAIKQKIQHIRKCLNGEAYQVMSGTYSDRASCHKQLVDIYERPYQKMLKRIQSISTVESFNQTLNDIEKNEEEMVREGLLTALGEKAFDLVKKSDINFYLETVRTSWLPVAEKNLRVGEETALGASVNIWRALLNYVPAIKEVLTSVGTPLIMKVATSTSTRGAETLQTLAGDIQAIKAALSEAGLPDARDKSYIEAACLGDTPVLQALAARIPAIKGMLPHLDTSSIMKMATRPGGTQILQTLSHDIQAIKAALSEAGWPDVDDKSYIEVACSGDPPVLQALPKCIPAIKRALPAGTSTALMKVAARRGSVEILQTLPDDVEAIKAALREVGLTDVNDNVYMEIASGEGTQGLNIFHAYISSLGARLVKIKNILAKEEAQQKVEKETDQKVGQAAKPIEIRPTLADIKQSFRKLISRQGSTVALQAFCECTSELDITDIASVKSIIAISESMIRIASKEEGSKTLREFCQLSSAMNKKSLDVRVRLLEDVATSWGRTISLENLIESLLFGHTASVAPSRRTWLHHLKQKGRLIFQKINPYFKVSTTVTHH